MSEDDHPDKIAREKDARAYETAVDTRKFEIGLFWQRSLFFWGFIGAAFVAFAALKDGSDLRLRAVVAAFGLVCSVAWQLVNRGSKYWQEAWEQKVERLELKVLSEPLFAKREDVMKDKGAIWGARNYSVTRLATALSDLTTLIWIILLSSSLAKKPDLLGFIAAAAAVGYIGAMLWGGPSKFKSSQVSAPPSSLPH